MSVIECPGRLKVAEKAVFGEKRAEYVPYLPTENDNCAEDSSGVYRNFENYVPSGLDTEQFPAYPQMPAAAHRQEFRQSLNQTEQESFIPIHIYFFLRGMVHPIIATTSITMPAIITRGAATSL